MMTAEDRVKTIAKFGFTERQARFLVTGDAACRDLCAAPVRGLRRHGLWPPSERAVRPASSSAGTPPSAAACTTGRASITCATTRSITPSVSPIAGTAVRCRLRASASA